VTAAAAKWGARERDCKRPAFGLCEPPLAAFQSQRFLQHGRVPRRNPSVRDLQR
jgi:hypothetical protein